MFFRTPPRGRRGDRTAAAQNEQAQQRHGHGVGQLGPRRRHGRGARRGRESLQQRVSKTWRIRISLNCEKRGA